MDATSTTEDWEPLLAAKPASFRRQELPFTSIRWTHLQKLPIFWRLQIAGWMAWTLCSMPINFAIYADIATAFWISCIRELTGFVLTLALREFFRRTSIEQCGVTIMAPVVIFVSLIAATIDISSLLLIENVLQLEETDYTQSGMWGFLFCLRALLLVSWSGLYLSFRGLVVARRQSEMLIHAEKQRHDA